MAETAPATNPSPAVPPPPLAPVATRPEAAPSPAPAAPVHIRGLFINLIFAMFAATVIFAIASYFFLVPRIAIQELHANRLDRDVRVLQAQVRELAAAQVQAPVPAPAEPAAPAAPAPAAAAPAAPAAAAPAPAAATPGK
ncbi:MAG TPA: hypothetical protein VGK67_02350 [Myxococcales bacterium]|jgi:predicted lipid-binding transport protein (Tim44 family)